jgi:GNAT superfamily N-acetyltransferase
MTLDFHEAGPADIDKISSLIPACYVNDLIFSQLMTTTPLEKRGAFWGGWIRDKFWKGYDKLLKVTDSTTGWVFHTSLSEKSILSSDLLIDFYRKVVAFTKSRYPGPVSKDQHTDEEIPFPEGTNVDLIGHWFDVMDKYYEKQMVPEKYDGKFSLFASCPLKLIEAVFHVIGTLPEYYRKSLGSKLIKKTIEDADRDNAGIYLQATKMCAKLSPRYRFNDIEEMTVNASKDRLTGGV